MKNIIEIQRHGVSRLPDMRQLPLAVNLSGVLAVQSVENVHQRALQRVEILKILLMGAEILIFDEPTATLTPQEIQDFFEICRVLPPVSRRSLDGRRRTARPTIISASLPSSILLVSIAPGYGGGEAAHPAGFRGVPF